ncbi:VOC family protein [Flagellimonas myxillae]|uniref:VOC family protein n=1 Tax=Flagellimonas myxillae TaxID=2942214 RepID=UPI00201EF332|nr:VOC family protein [Muricauda myxillae]MCL6265530.1 VOC family protein [Muricauda myxillae]
MKHKLLFGLVAFFALNLGIAQSEFDKSSISIGVIVTDLDASLDFYTNIIGMKKSREFSIDEAFGKKSGLSGGAPFTVRILKLEEDEYATEFKIVHFDNDKTPGGNYIQDGNRMRYITLFYKNLDAVIQRLKAKNIKFLSEEPTHIGDGRRFVLVQDPDGVFVELIGK